MAPLIDTIHPFQAWLKPGDFLPAVVLPHRAEYEAILPKNAPPRVYRLGKPSAEMNLGLIRTATAMDFRPLLQEASLSRNPELAVAVGPDCNGIERYDLALECRISPLLLADATCVIYSHDGMHAAAGSDEGMVKVWKLTNHGPVEILCELVARDRIVQVALSSNNDVLFAVTARGDFVKIVVQPGAKPGACMSPKHSDGSPFSFDCYEVSCHPHDNAVVAFGGNSNVVYLVNYRTGKVFNLNTKLGQYAREVRFLPNGQEISIIGELGVEVWNLRNLGCVRSLNFNKFVTARQYGAKLYVAVV